MKTYAIDEKMLERHNNNFTYHAPIAGQAQKYEEIRAKAKEFGLLMMSYTPASREQSLALTNLEQAVFWANAAIARNEKGDDDG